MELYRYKVHSVDKIVDGDTVDLTIDLGFNILIKQRIRLFGIDAPEIRTKDLVEKEYGVAAKSWLYDAIFFTDLLYIQTVKQNDKYGRILGILYVGNSEESINEQMVLEGYAIRM